MRKSRDQDRQLDQLVEWQENREILQATQEKKKYSARKVWGV